MPWSMKDYPASLKNLEKPVKKKAIEIANAMIDEGYEDGRAIPIATSKAKEWAENASKRKLTTSSNMMMKQNAMRRQTMTPDLS